jgi:hypothetical protein
MAKIEDNSPDFFEERPFDPVNVAIGPGTKSGRVKSKEIAADTKRKAGFYLSVDILNRFNRKFHELKLEGIAVENKSALLELALSFALDDMDKFNESRVLNRFMPKDP